MPIFLLVKHFVHSVFNKTFIDFFFGQWVKASWVKSQNKVSTKTPLTVQLTLAQSHLRAISLGPFLKLSKKKFPFYDQMELQHLSDIEKYMGTWVLTLTLQNNLTSLLWITATQQKKGWPSLVCKQAEYRSDTSPGDYDRGPLCWHRGSRCRPACIPEPSPRISTGSRCRAGPWSSGSHLAGVLFRTA